MTHTKAVCHNRPNHCWVMGLDVMKLSLSQQKIRWWLGHKEKPLLHWNEKDLEERN